MIARQVIDGTLERPLWTHEAHLAFAAGVVRLYGAEASMDLSREAIRRYNEASKCANTDTNGYHETLTAYYCAAVAAAVAQPSTDGLLLEAEPLLARDAPLQFWDRETLFSVAARRGWVPPTTPLPFPLPFQLG